MKHHALTDKARSLVSQIAALDAELLDTLNSIVAAQVFKAEGCCTMHDYCVECLGMSSDQAYRKLQAARLMQRFPTEVRTMLESGDAKLTHLAMIAPVVTEANATQLFDEVRGKSTRDVERMLRREDPKPEVSEAIGRVAALRHESLEMLAPDRWALRAMMDDATKTLYDEVADLLSTDEREPGNVVRLALIELRERLLIKKRRKLRTTAKPLTEKPPAEKPQTEKPQTEKPQTEKPRIEQPQTEQPQTEQPASLVPDAPVGPRGETRYIPSALARLVYDRDKSCQFVGESGRKCGSTRNLQLHHLDPWARGGQTTAENLIVFCRCHNLYQGELDFGPRRAARAFTGVCA